MRAAVTAVLVALILPAAAQAQIENPGPCTQAAALGMPEGDDHDHNEPSQHQGLFCRMQRVYFGSLKNGELDGGSGAKFPANAQLGELDIKGDIAAVAVAQPVGGALFFGVSDPAHPKFLSRYVDAGCTLSSDCGAYVEMMSDGKWALLGVQQTDLMPGLITGYASQAPGVKLIDLRDPTKPVLAQEYTTASVEGIHTARSFVIKDGPFAGEYAFFIQNGVGIEIARVEDMPAGKRMARIANIVVPDSTNTTSIHDTFIQTDPTDGKTYLYAAGGFTFGFRVYDLSNPAAPAEVADWDLTPECRNDWYSHTIDVTTIAGHRYVTLPTEGFSFGNQADAGEQCGDQAGNGDKPSPMWIVDATDWSKLGTSSDDAATLASKSADALVTTWSNPAGREAGQLTFSAHNQQIVGEKIMLTSYHGGIFWLDASGAFHGRHERPRELAWADPFDADVRPTLDYGSFVHYRGDFWDANYYKGYIFGADISGGIYTLNVAEGDAATPGAPSCTDELPPQTTFTAKLSRKGLLLRGKAGERGCNGVVERVLVSLALQAGRRCRFVSAKGRLAKPASCAKPHYVTAAGTTDFALGLRAKLPKGRYRVTVRAFDGAGNIGAATKRLRVR
jgi:hypothetical protein